ncbi:(2Fe-2S)-binding protein [Aneurinibacillus sp. REN35]|uniref:(2Fe-2S)-binding protein n=1 Tax=Aneurinibacillus sp. REN35 TaxID=3237286 RepID=UPI003527E9CC
MKRIMRHPILGNIEDRERISFQFDGVKYEAYENETVAAALLANGIRKLRVHEDTGTPRGIYCNIGHCLECRVTINKQANVRACVTMVEKNMVIESGKQYPNIVRGMVEGR